MMQSLTTKIVFSSCEDCAGIGQIVTDSTIQNKVNSYGSDKSNAQAMTCLITDSVTNMDLLFQYSAFQGDLSCWNTVSVTTMTRMFYFSDFSGDISTWSVGSVTNMDQMFRFAIAFNSDLSGWDVSTVTSMDVMFGGAKEFNGNISSWDVSSIPSYYKFLDGAKKFNQDLSSWDVSVATRMNYMFKNAIVFKNTLEFWNIESVTNMNYMFQNAAEFIDPLCWGLGKKVTKVSMLLNSGCAQCLEKCIYSTTSPTIEPSVSKLPSRGPIISKSFSPTTTASASPSAMPTTSPSAIPSQSLAPTVLSSSKPSAVPNSSPSSKPSTPLPTRSPSITFSSFPSLAPTAPPSSNPPSASPSSNPPSASPSSSPPSSQPTFVPSKSNVPTSIPTVVASYLPTITVTDYQEDKKFYLPSYKECKVGLSCNLIEKFINDGKDKCWKICFIFGGDAKCPKTCAKCTSRAPTVGPIPSKTSISTNLISLTSKRSSSDKPKDSKSRFSVKDFGKEVYTCKDFKEGIATGDPVWCKLCLWYGVDEVCKKTCVQCNDIKDDFFLPSYKECTEVLSCKIIKKWKKEGRDKACNICLNGGNANCRETCKKCPRGRPPTITPTVTPSDLPTDLSTNPPTAETTDIKTKFYLPTYKECTKVLTCEKIEKLITKGKDKKACKICSKHGADAKCPKTCRKCLRTRVFTFSRTSTDTSIQNRNPAHSMNTASNKEGFRLPLYKECTVLLTCKKIKKYIKKGIDKGCKICLTFGGNSYCGKTCEMCLKK